MHSHLLPTLTLLLVLVLLTLAHSDHSQAPLSPSNDWATRHLAEEHHISNFDAGAFFSLHDYDSSGGWTADEVSRTYGLDDESMKDVGAEKRREVVEDVMRRFDRDGDGVVGRGEWMEGWRGGERLQDFGVGGAHSLGILGRMGSVIDDGKEMLTNCSSLGLAIMEMTSMSTRSIILKSTMMRVSPPPPPLAILEP
jgi:hypothetical protein